MGFFSLSVIFFFFFPIVTRNHTWPSMRAFLLHCGGSGPQWIQALIAVFFIFLPHLSHTCPVKSQNAPASHCVAVSSLVFECHRRPLTDGFIHPDYVRFYQTMCYFVQVLAEFTGLITGNWVSLSLWDGTALITPPPSIFQRPTSRWNMWLPSCHPVPHYSLIEGNWSVN